MVRSMDRDMVLMVERASTPAKGLTIVFGFLRGGTDVLGRVRLFFSFPITPAVTGDSTKASRTAFVHFLTGDRFPPPLVLRLGDSPSIFSASYFSSKSFSFATELPRIICKRD